MADLDTLLRFGNELGNGRFVARTHRKAGWEIKKVGLRNIEKAIGSDRIMRNYPRPGRTRKASIVYKIKGDELAIRFVPAGMFGILEGPHPPDRKPVTKTRAVSTQIWLREYRKLVRKALR